MLSALCGNGNIQHILLFLFVNGHCYGTQLQRKLHAALTPIQNALQRLEKGGIISSYYQGKTRIFQFNPSYPLLSELELLLKKTYTLLPADQKKLYYLPRAENRSENDSSGIRQRTLLDFWDRLLQVKQLRFQVHSKSEEAQGWNGRGEGEVVVAKENDNKIIFQEKGRWINPQGGEVSFSNVFRWSLDRLGGVVALEHLRRGADNPVFLFYLTPAGRQSLTSVDSHLCVGDAYFGQIHFDVHGLRLHWRVIGPKKNEELSYNYS